MGLKLKLASFRLFELHKLQQHRSVLVLIRSTFEVRNYLSGTFETRNNYLSGFPPLHCCELKRSSMNKPSIEDEAARAN